MKNSFFILLLLFFSFYSLNAQKNFELFYLADTNDTERMLNAYFTPRINGYTNALNNGWHTSSKAHKPFGFDFSVSLNNLVYPSNKKTFKVENLASVNIPNGSLNGNSSIGNSNTNTATITTNINNETGTAVINLPENSEGKLLANASIPIMQLNVGLPNKFEILLKFLPEMKPNNDNESMNVFGFGLKKEITEWFPKLEKLPINISLLAAYSNMNVNYGIANRDLSNSQNSGLEVQNGITDFKLNAFTFQAAASWHWQTINLFGSFGYNIGNATQETFGTFNGKYQGNSGILTRSINTTNTIDYNSNSLSATLGARINLRYFKIFSSYNLQEVSNFNLGVAISIK